MPAEATWSLIGQSFLWLGLGLGLLGLALLVVKRWPSKWRRLWIPMFLLALPPLALWLVMVFTAAYPTIHQTSDGRTCLDPSGEEVDCESEEWQRIRGGE